MAEHMVDFWIYAALSGWREDVLRDVCQRSLADHLRDEIVLRDEPSDLEALITLAMQLDNRTSRTLLKATLSWQNRSLHLSALVDSGADESFLDREVARQLGIDFIPLDLSMEVNLSALGMHLARIEH